jgi:hypothetical protein
MKFTFKVFAKTMESGVLDDIIIFDADTAKV